jgi:hypothetical protein
MKTVSIILNINGKSIVRKYALSDTGMLPDGMQENLQDMCDQLLEVKE